MKSIIRNKIVSSPTSQHLIRESKSWYIPGFYGLSVYEVLPAFVRQLRKNSLVERASGISFNVVMAIPPMIIFAFTLIPLLPISQRFINELFSLIRDIIPGEKDHAVIIGFLSDFLNQPRTGLLSFGLLLAIYFSSNALMGVLRAFDRNYPGFIRRSLLQKRRVAVQLTLILFVLVFTCLLLLIAQGQVLQWLGVESAFWRSLIHNVRWVIIFGLIFYIVAFLYRHGPSLERRWPFLTPGSIFATSMMIIATGIVSYWVNNFSNYNKLYGSISAIFVLMSLIYVNSLAVLLGFELNVTLTRLQIEKRPKPAAAPVKG